MSFSESDLLAIHAAIERGERSVQFADRSVTYRSMDELLAVEACIRRDFEVAYVASLEARIADLSKALGQVVRITKAVLTRD